MYFSDGNQDQVGHTTDPVKKANWMRYIQSLNHRKKREEQPLYESPSLKMNDWYKSQPDLQNDIPGQSTEFNSASRQADNDDVPRMLGTELGVALMAGAAAAVAAGELAAVPWVAGAGAFFALSDNVDHDGLPSQELDEVA